MHYTPQFEIFFTKGNEREIMKVLNRLLALGVLAFLAACGGSSSTAANPATSCAAGSIYSSQYGSCLPQGNCQSGYGMYQNQCVAGTTTGVSSAVCSDGQASTQYGCMTRANCQPGTAYYAGATQGSNQCVPMTPTGSCTGADVYSAQYGCVPQTGCGMGMGMSIAGCVAATNTTNYGQPGTGGYNPGYPGGGNGGYNNGGMNSCPAGTYYTVAGCLSQGPCMSGQVIYNNQCYYLVQQGGGGYGGGGSGFQIHFGF